MTAVTGRLLVRQRRRDASPALDRVVESHSPLRDRRTSPSKRPERLLVGEEHSADEQDAE